VAFSRDGKRLVSGSGDFNKRGEMKVWDGADGPRTLSPSMGHTPLCDAAVAFQPDGKQVVSGMYGPGRVKVWDAQTGQQISHPRRHTGFVYSVAFSPDGKRLASGSDDRT